MTQPAFLAWVEFYKLNPFDDYSRYYRPAALIAHQVRGMELDSLLGWLERKPVVEYSEADAKTMKAFGMKPPRN